jgi:hypothetical protein
MMKAKERMRKQTLDFDTAIVMRGNDAIFHNEPGEETSLYFFQAS